MAYIGDWPGRESHAEVRQAGELRSNAWGNGIALGTDFVQVHVEDSALDDAESGGSRNLQRLCKVKVSLYNGRRGMGPGSIQRHRLSST